MEVKQEPTDICNEEIQAPQSYAEFLDIDNFLKDMTEDELYKSFLNDNGGGEATFSSLPDISNYSTEVLPSLPIATQIATSPSQSISQTPQQVQVLPVKKEVSSVKTSSAKKQKVEKQKDERYHKRLVANKKSAQASRERKKLLRGELEDKIVALTKENANLLISITAVETENKVLQNEFVQLQNMINDSTSMTKFAAMQQYNNPLQYDTSAALKGIVSSPMATALYMMVVLNSFSHIFNKQAAFSDTAQSLLSSSNTIEVN